MATNITYVLSLDSSGAVSSVNKVTKSFDQLEASQQKFAKLADKISATKLETYINDLKKIKDLLGTMKPSFDLGKMAAQTTAQINKASNLLEQRLQQIQVKQVAQMQSGFGLFTRIESTLASRTPAQRKADTLSTQSEYKNKLEAENKALKEQARISAETSAQRKKDEQELANFLLKQEEDLLAKMRGRWNTFASEQKQFEQAELARVAKLATDELKAKEVALTAYNQALSANSNSMKALFLGNTSIHKAALKDNEDWEKSKIAELLSAHKNYQNKLREDEKARLQQSQADNEAWAARIKANWDKIAADQKRMLEGNTSAQAKPIIPYVPPTKDWEILQNLLKLAKQALDLVNASFRDYIKNVKEAREGASKLEKENLSLVNTIKEEIANRNRLKAELASINPLLQQAATLRKKELELIADIARANSEFSSKIQAATSVQQIQSIINQWKVYIQTQKDALKNTVEQGDAAVKSYEKQQAALQRLQQSALRGVDIKATAWNRSGTLGQMSASGASADAIKGQQIRFQLEDIDKRYAKLVSAFQKGLLKDNMDATKIANLTQKFDYLSGKLEKARTTVQQALGEIEKLTKGVHQLDQVHKPFLERIFDLVVGYKLINAAVNTFTNAMRSVPEAGLQFETTYATLKAVFSVTTKVNQELKFLDDLAQSAGISIDTLRSSFVDFAASAKFSGEKVENIQEIFANISKAGMVLHLPADKMKSAFTALNQMYAKNQVMMEELKRQLGNQLPAAVNIFALSMGKTTRQLMDDMKKGLVVPKETILNFSRTYAAMFADPASLEYASQGVNAHIQRLSTAWTNFATTVYEQSKGAIKGGLSIATSAVDFLTKHMTALANITVVAGVALGGALVMHLGKATLAYMQASKAVIAFAAAQTTMLGTSVAVGELGLLQTIKAFTVGTLAAIPSWVSLVAALGTAVMVMKDLEVGTVTVKSSLNQLNGTVIDVKKSITLGDTVLAGWDLLIAKLEKLKDLVPKLKPDDSSKNFITGLGNEPQEGNSSFWESAMLNQAKAMFPAQASGIQGFYEASKQEAARQKIMQEAGEEAARQTEYVNEKVKEALLAGTTGTVDETMAGMNKTVTIALQRITTEFDIATQRLQGQTSLRVKELQLEITKVQSQEALGTITKGQALSKVKNIQDEIYKANKKALSDENALLKEQLSRVELIGDAKLENSNQAKLAATQEDKLAKIREARANIVGILPTLKDSPYEDRKAAEEALGSGTLPQALKTQAVEEWNKNNPTKPLFDKIDVTNKAILEQTKALDKARDEYAKITTEHSALQLRVAEGTTTSNDFLEKIAANTDPTNVTPVEFTGVASAGASATTATDSAKKAIEFFISKGWKPEQAIGITANIQGESSFNTSTVGDGGVAYGLGQWHPDRQANFAKAFGKSIKGSSFEEQLAFVDWELKNTEARAGSLLKATRTVAEATNSVTANYERPKYTSKDQAIRRSIAETYLPSSGYVKSGADPIAQNALDLQRKLEANIQKGKEQDIEKQQADIEAAKASLLENLANTKTTLQASLQLSKTTKETELAKLDNLAFPLSDKQRLAKTAEINTKANPELVSQIDKLVANAKETILKTADTATKSGLQAEILTLEKDRASISAETLKDKVAIELNKIIPLQDALDRKQFEIQKSLEESLGIFNEETIVMSQRLSQEDTVTLLYKEQAKLKGQSQGMSEQEKKVIQDKIDKTKKHIDQLNQIELIKAKIANEENNIKAQQGLYNL